MKFDTLVIGGGLSGLVCGIKLQEAGQKCAIVSAGQNAMHFSSGTFGLLDRMPNGEDVEKPLEGIKKLIQEDKETKHPYSKVGYENICNYAEETVSFFGKAGIKLCGSNKVNSNIISATGDLKKVWMSFEDITLLKSDISHKKVLIINLLGYMDFNAGFIEESLKDKGTECRRENIVLDEMEWVRKNPSEMRAVNIARVLDNPKILQKFIDEVIKIRKDEEIIILPAIFGFKVHSAPKEVIEKIEKTGAKVMCIGTMPPSVPGIRTQLQLKKRFEDLGGIFLLGDEVTKGDFNNDSSKLVEISTKNLSGFNIEAENFVLASGGLFSKGIIADPYKFYEPVFSLDVDYTKDRNGWYNKDFFGKQPYMEFGIKTTTDLHAVKENKAIDNLYVCGSALAGSNPLFEGSGAGTAIMTAFKVADEILTHNN